MLQDTNDITGELQKTQACTQRQTTQYILDRYRQKQADKGAGKETDSKTAAKQSRQATETQFTYCMKLYAVCVWSFGLVLIEMFAKQRAWGDADIDQLYGYRYRKEAPPALAHVPEDIFGLCHSCVLYDPRDRPTMMVIIKELNVLEGLLNKHNN